MNYRLIVDSYKDALDKFLPGIAEHATLIKFEHVTPDLSITCFRTSANGGNFYFCLLEYDYMHTIKYANKVVGSSFAKVIEYIPPVEKQKGRTQLEQKSVGEPGSFFLLARTERPKGKGYWASNIVLMPGDEIAPKIAHLSEQDKQGFMGTYLNVVNSQPSASAKPDPNNFMGGWQSKVERQLLTADQVTMNDTRLAISIYKNLSGSWESFYNYVNSTN